MVFYVSEYVYFQGRHTEGIGLKRPVVYKPKYSMTTLDSRTAPDCRTSQAKVDIAHTLIQSQLSSLFISVFFHAVKGIRLEST